MKMFKHISISEENIQVKAMSCDNLSSLKGEYRNVGASPLKSTGEGRTFRYLPPVPKSVFLLLKYQNRDFPVTMFFCLRPPVPICPSSPPYPSFADITVLVLLFRPHLPLLYRFHTSPQPCSVFARIPEWALPFPGTF